MHDARIGRFFAVDPLTSKYPHYTPYSFSGNKLIHAVELEGLEEKIIILSDEYEGGRMEISMSNYETIQEFVNVRNSWSEMVFNYEDAWDRHGNYDYFKTLNIGGSYGFKFKDQLTIDLNGDNISASYTITDNLYGSVYAGPSNPKDAMGDDEYGIYPQDMADASARVHDMDYDLFKISGANGVLKESSTEANMKLIATTRKIQQMYLNKDIDPFTNMPVSLETYERAKSMNFWFTEIELRKQYGLSPTILDMMEMKNNIDNRVENIDIYEATRRSDFE